MTYVKYAIYACRFFIREAKSKGRYLEFEDAARDERGCCYRDTLPHRILYLIQKVDGCC